MKIIILLFSFAATAAYADVSSDFNFESASQAFKAAPAPAQSELLGAWMQVGDVTASRKVPELYSPDGWFKYKNGFYRGSLEFRLSGIDPFGQPHYTSSYKTVDQATGNVLQQFADESWNQAVVSVMATPSETSREIKCGQEEECRLLKNGLLLCEWRNTGSRYCTTLFPESHRFRGYVRPQP